MIGVQPLAKQHMHLFDANSEEDAILRLPKVSDKQQQLTEKVRPIELCQNLSFSQCMVVVLC